MVVNLHERRRINHVWNTYRPEIEAFGLGDRALSIMLEAEDHVELDVKLDLLVTAYRRHLRPRVRAGPLDGDIGSYRTIATKLLEESN